MSSKTITLLLRDILMRYLEREETLRNAKLLCLEC